MFNQCRIDLFCVLNMLETMVSAFLFTFFLFFFLVLKALRQINTVAQKSKAQINLLKRESIYHNTNVFAETQIS